MNCDVPQGYSLGPLLFLMYVNYLLLASRFKTTLFADDTYLSLANKDINNLQKEVNYELQNTDFWLRKNKFTLNYNKTNYMLINNHPQVPHQKIEKMFN